MMANIDNMARFEREIEKRMETACGKFLVKVDASKRIVEIAA